MEAEINIVHCPVDGVGKWLSEAFLLDKERIFVVCDHNVGWLVEKIGIEDAKVFEIEATEQGKTLDTILEIDRWMMENGADRNSFVLGIGGGITTDIVGFAASVYKRGVRFGFVPTTLLSQVDAAIGGKNGVNLDSYKNMIGVFRQPEVTFICPEPLETLPYPQLVSGAAELLKTFIINNDGGLYHKTVELLSRIHVKPTIPFKEYSEELNELVAAAANVKAGIAGRDPEEHGERRLLNLGHTFAHAIEKLSGESICHGNAVAMGIILAARLAAKAGMTEGYLERTLTRDFNSCGLPVECPFGIQDMAEAMRKDKKADGDKIHFVIPLGIGNVETKAFTPEEVVRLLED